jgi:hypothetical protein
MKHVGNESAPVASDAVNHPPHYQGKAGLEVIDVIRGLSVELSHRQRCEVRLAGRQQGKSTGRLRKGRMVSEPRSGAIESEGKIVNDSKPDQVDTLVCQNEHRWQSKRLVIADAWIPEERSCPTCGRLYLYTDRTGAAS